MFSKTIQDIISARLQQLPEILLAGDLRRDIDDLIATHLPYGEKIAIIDDIDTASAYGNLVFKALKDKYHTAHITLPRFVLPDEETLEFIKLRAENAALLIAVGSGTINDLVKRAAFIGNKPYILFPTAASMNGYCSANASIYINTYANTYTNIYTNTYTDIYTKNEYGKSSGNKAIKTSLSGCLPLAVYVDMQTLLAAPLRLAKAGIGDSLARPTAQADWLLSHHLLNTAYDETAYLLTKDSELQVFTEPEAIIRKDSEAMQELFKLLLLSGFAMTICGGSFPASGSEHMLAHLMNENYSATDYYAASKKDHSDNKIPSLHGEEIAITAPFIADIQEKLLNRSEIKLRAIEGFSQEKEQYSNHSEYQEKAALIRSRFPDNIITKTIWQNACAAIAEIHIAPEKLRLIRKKAQLPENIVEIGWQQQQFEKAVKLARFTRKRFTFLDVE